MSFAKDLYPFLQDLQQQICHSLLPNLPQDKGFIFDNWQESPSYYGTSAIAENCEWLEKAGVNISYISKDSLPQAALESKQLANQAFAVCGLSLVLHPHSPMVPTSHMNIRFFVLENGTWWFGGGYDLTPYFPFEVDCVHWHQVARKTCENFQKGLYKKYKKACDGYFWLPHRQETRGVGGIFFDGLNSPDYPSCLAFWQAVGRSFLEAYSPIFDRTKDLAFSQEQKDFQLYRRGRYAEFNLLFDRGTKFGLESFGRVESILMSLPPVVKWSYFPNGMQSPFETRLLEYLKPRDWV